MSRLALARKIVKVVAIVIGLVATLPCLMSIVGLVTASGWVRGAAAILVAFAVPAVIADRLLPSTPDEKSKGLPSDVYALTWVGFPTLFAVLFGSLTRSMLITEADRLHTGGVGSLARVSYLLAGVRAEQAPPPPSAVPSAASAVEPAVASAPPVALRPSPAASGSGSAPPPATARPAPGTEVNAAELFKKLAPAVVTVSVGDGAREGGGTGFLIDKAGTVVTNHHVIEGMTQCTIKTLTGSVYDDVWVLSDDPAADLTLLQVDVAKPKSGDAPDYTVIALGDSEKVEVGEPVFVIGNPLGLDHTLTTGIVSARRTYESKKWIQMSAPISPGNSGGPVFNGRGEAIGIATAVITGYGRAQNLNLAIPVDQLKSMIKSDYPGKRKLGKGGLSGSW